MAVAAHRFFQLVEFLVIYRFFFFDFDQYPFHSLDEYLNLNGFEEVIDGVVFKTIDGVLIKSSDKNNKGVLLDLFQQVKSGFFIQDDVQKKEVIIVVVDQLHGPGVFVGNIDVIYCRAILFQKVFEQFRIIGFIFYNEYINFSNGLKVL